MLEVLYQAEQAELPFPMWMPIAILLMIGIIGVFIFMLTMHLQNRKIVKGMLMCEFTTDAGKSYKVLLPYRAGTVSQDGKKFTGSVLGHKKQESKSRMIYGVREDAVYDSWWPEGGLFSFLGTQVGKVYYREGNPEPQMKRTERQVMTPDFIGYLADQNTAELAFEATARIRELEEKIAEMLNPKIVYIGLALAVATAGIAVYLLIQMTESLDILKAAAGV